jgi:hypothetical protein
MKPGTPVYWKDPIRVDSGMYVIDSLESNMEGVDVVLVSKYNEIEEHVVPLDEVSPTENTNG